MAEMSSSFSTSDGSVAMDSEDASKNHYAVEADLVQVIALQISQACCLARTAKTYEYVCTCLNACS